MKELKDKIAELVEEKEDYTLEDVLIAINDSMTKGVKIILVNGETSFIDLRFRFENEFFEWKLNKPLSEQSEKTKQFLMEIL